VPEHANPELKKLERAMLKLPRSTREIFLAHRLDDMSYLEIADRTGLTVRQIERHMAKAIYRLCKELDDEPHWWERLAPALTRIVAPSPALESSGSRGAIATLGRLVAIILRQFVGWLWRTENN
jgi:hypothetical protein